MRRLGGERGSALAQVLVFATVSCLICASLLRVRLQGALAGSRAAGRLQDGLAAQAAMSRADEVWTRLGACASDAAAGVSCGARPPTCDCTCAVATGPGGAPAATVKSYTLPNGSCAVSAWRP